MIEELKKALEHAEKSYEVAIEAGAIHIAALAWGAICQLKEAIKSK